MVAYTDVEISSWATDITPPTINGPSESISIPENTTGVYTFTANEPVTWSLEPHDYSPDEVTHFSIDSTSGSLVFNTAPDYETPKDMNGVNNYDPVSYTHLTLPTKA